MLVMVSNTEKIANSIFLRALKDVKPSKRELELSVRDINELTGRLKKIVPKEVEIRVVGSVVRSTQLRGDSDIDIFLLFSKTKPREQITKEGLEYAKKLVTCKEDRYEIKYAQHPYTRIYLGTIGVKADIVPAFNIDNIEDMGTAVDRSPMHADFINAHFTDAQRDDVRLMKYLLKSQNIYGAEVKTSGFSGYLCELLVYQYGSLFKLLESAAEFKLPIMLDPKNKVALQDQSLLKRFNSRFVVIDPIDKNRNVAAGVSLESLAKFVIVAREFTERPSILFFRKRDVAPENSPALLKKFLVNSGLDMYVIVTNIPDKTEDVIWPQLRKVSEFIAGQVKRLSLNVYISIPVVVGDKGLLVFFAPKETITTRLHDGPSAFIRKAQKEFVDAHKNAVGVMLHGDILYALDKNKYSNIREIMQEVTSGKLAKRHKDIKLRGAKLFVNKIPKEFADRVYIELMNRIRLY